MFVEVLYQIRTCPKVLRWLAALIVLLWLGTWRQSFYTKPQHDESFAPLVRRHIDHGSGHGGRWYIPPSWTDHLDDLDDDLNLNGPSTPTEAATLALGLAMRKDRFLSNTKIPLIVHQTWKSLDSTTWPDIVRKCVNQWLEVAVGGDDLEEPATAYIMWDDTGVEEFMKVYENSSWSAIEMMPYKVERADVFRVAVLKWFGGVYADVDTKPLKHPAQWIQREDIQPWRDPASRAEQTLHEPSIESSQTLEDTTLPPSFKADAWANTISSGYRKAVQRNKSKAVDVAAIVGVEADNPEDSDDYWRMGYSFPLQLTNWAMAMAPQHPIASRYITQVTNEIIQNATRLKEVEILDLTGPPAFTKAVKELCELEDPNFRWASLTGRLNPVNSTGKVAAGDVVVLPVTGFSPGRTNLWPHKSMGSQPLDHSQARLLHEFANSWRHDTIKVEVGKFCRTFFGLCRDWSKMP